MWLKRGKGGAASEQHGEHKPAASARFLQVSNVDDEEIPRYPPFMRGLPAASVLRVMGTQKDMVERLQQTLGLDPRVFDDLVTPVLHRYVAFVHLLPASHSHHHRGAGGLLRHGLEVAFFAARASEGVVFVPFGTPRERHEHEPRWHVAVALAGLLHDLGKSVADVGVTDREGKSEWQPYLETLLEWAAGRGVERYFLRWNERRHKQHEMYNKMVADRVLTPEIIQWLSNQQPEIARTLFETVTGANVDSDMYRLVLEADQKSVEADLKANHMSVGASLGVPVEKHMLDAMRCLMSNGAWATNERGARVWVLKDGVFVAWKQAAEEIVDFLAKDRIPGIPRNHDTLADILIERGLAKPRALDSGATYRYWPVSPAVLRTKTGESVTLYMLKLASPQILFSTEPVCVEAAVGDDVDRDEAKMIQVSATDGARASSSTERPPDANVAVKETATLQGGVSKNIEPSTETKSVDWLQRNGAAGTLLLAMIHDVATGKASVGQVVSTFDDLVLITFPNGVARYGEPSHVMESLDRQGWIAVDPMSPLRKVRELNGVRGLVLTEEPAKHVRTLLARSVLWLDDLKISEPHVPSRKKFRSPKRTMQAQSKLPEDRDAGKFSTPKTAEGDRPMLSVGEAVDWPSGVAAFVAELLKAIRRRDPAVGDVVESGGRLRVSRQAIEAVALRAGVRLARLYTQLQATPACSLDGEHLFLHPGDGT